MKIQGSLAVSAAELQRTSYQPQTSSVRNTPGNDGRAENLAARRFDSVTIYGSDGRQNAYEMELRSRISQEVRTATSSGMIVGLREQIRTGAYHIDAAAIAGKMLLLGGNG